MLVLTTVFGDTHPASADEMYTTTAQEASEMDTMEAMRNFVLNVKEHSEKLRADNEHAEFRAEMRTDDGVWKSGTTYIITVNTKTEGLRRTFEAGELVNFHAEHPAASNGSLKHIGIFQELVTEVEGAGGEARLCSGRFREVWKPYLCRSYCLDGGRRSQHTCHISCGLSS